MSKTYAPSKDAVWFITGSNSGIGKAFAAYLSTTSYRLVAAARNVSRLDFLPGTSNVLKVTLDITSAAGVKDAVAQAIAVFGRIDVLTTFWGATNLMREAVRVMREENPKTGQIGGVCCYMSAATARVALVGGSYYYATRFAMDAFMDSFSKELHPDWNIHMLEAMPGGVRTGYIGRSITIGGRHPAYLDPACGTSKMVEFTKMENADAIFDPPEKLVEIVVETVEKGDIPLRLPLGADSWELVKAELEKLLQEHEAIRPVSYQMNAEASEALHKLTFQN